MLAKLLPLCCAALAAASIVMPASRADVAGARYRVVCHFECGALAYQALAVAEAAAPFAARVYGELSEPSRPLEIHLYRTAAEYRAARSGLLRRAPRPLAVTDPSSGTAHIALRSTIGDTTLNRVGLPPNILRVVAHEAFHLAAVAVNPQISRLPEWFNEGAASWAEQQVLQAAGVVADHEPEPVLATYLWLMQRRARLGSMPRLAAVLSDNLRALDPQERYAVQQLLFAQIAETEDGALPSIVAAALAGSRRGDGPARALNARLVPDDRSAAALERALRESALGARLSWAQASRSLDLLPDGSWLQVGLSGDAEAWRIRYAASLRLGGAVEALTPGIARLFIGLAEPGHIVAEFDVAEGEIRLRRSGDDAPLARAPLPAPIGRIAFELDAADGIVQLRAGGSTVTAAVPAAAFNGMWGVGATRGTNLLWFDVALRG
jgi:hypothetical protein